MTNSNRIPPVVVAKFFQSVNFDDTEIEEITRKLQEAIIDDPIISDPSAVSVAIEKTGLFKDGIAHLVGSVRNEEESRRVEEIVTRNTRGEINISNELQVKS